MAPRMPPVPAQVVRPAHPRKDSTHQGRLGPQRLGQRERPRTCRSRLTPQRARCSQTHPTPQHLLRAWQALLAPLGRPARRGQGHHQMPTTPQLTARLRIRLGPGMRDCRRWRQSTLTEQAPDVAHRCQSPPSHHLLRSRTGHWPVAAAAAGRRPAPAGVPPALGWGQRSFPRRSRAGRRRHQIRPR